MFSLVDTSKYVDIGSFFLITDHYHDHNFVWPLIQDDENHV